MKKEIPPVMGGIFVGGYGGHGVYVAYGTYDVYDVYGGDVLGKMFFVDRESECVL